ncbi:M13 family metallopeptidase [Candidatus Sulfidibacterium hydrothermale]|uniref:M13 family metallopeptidase n=1 Tax=Candidatus Sulfidibacterium hydrothermale TaxID=2875962 RepID=UPI001F0B6994|nr:M13 family metallopeptidase [Candidatus Sulfidibacterium hydrothermale]UBM63259.1 M13 family metallopeptidase [Candidatus Sulfidibacterium hydrothermale]
MTKAINPANMDPSVKPGDNFYLYVNGGWIKSHPIPPEYSQYGAFTVLYENNQKELKALVDEIAQKKNVKPGSIEQKIRDFYNSGMDTVRIEKQGINPVKPELERIAAIKNKQQVQQELAHLHTIGVHPLFYFYAGADEKNSTMEIANLYQGGLGLPDVSYYTEDTPTNKKLRQKYQKHIANMFRLKGDDAKTADKKAAEVMALETQLAKTSFTRQELRSPEKNYNKMPLDKLQKLAPGLNWKAYFTGIGLQDPGEINVGQPRFFTGMSQLLEETPVKVWQAYFEWNVLSDAAPYLSKKFVQENFNFYGKTMSGQEKMRPRWKRVMGATSSGLGEALGQLYVAKYFPPESKERMLKLVNNLKLAFADRIRKLDWMSDTTKKKAIEKLKAITVKVGYPDKWRDYSKLEVVPDNYFQNIMNASKFEFEYNLNKVGKPVDKSEWGMTPQTVNAYYNPSNNEIVFPAGILQPPFFNKDADDAVNYGAIGMVIGHEMTHGFDDQGRKYDKNGNMKNWWTAADARRFKAKTEKLAKLYDHYTLLDSLHINGQMTMGENIADLGGLNISYDAYQMALNGKKPPVIDGFTGTQRFFIAYAQVWRQNIRPQELAKRLKTDVHSPGEARVNIPPFNMDVFIKAFDIKPGDKLYIPPKDRAYIW